jgi:hypothetical protein
LFDMAMRPDLAPVSAPNLACRRTSLQALRVAATLPKVMVGASPKTKGMAIPKHHIQDKTKPIYLSAKGLC